VAKLTPAEYLRQVRVEAIEKVSWPSRRETVSTAIMVVIMTSILAVFFFGVDAIISTIVKFLLGFLA